MISKALTPKEIRKKLMTRWERGDFYKKKEELFPLSVSTGRITSKEIWENYDELRNWVNLYYKDKSLSPYIIWETVNNRIFGKNELPAKLVFENIRQLSDYLNRQDELNHYNSLIDKLHTADSRLGPWGIANPFSLLESEEDLNRLLLLWKWIIDHPRPNIYLRQIDLPGIDTKFTEQYKRILSQWLDLTLPDEMISQQFKGVNRFEERYGFKRKPELIRFRFLDSSLEWRGCSDISLPANQFCRLYQNDESLPIDRVFIVENDICGLAFPPVKNSIVVLGSGYFFDNWRDALWLKSVPIYYWGDLDTHGFAILDQFREHFPQTISLLMDRKTLMNNETSWGSEPKPIISDLKNLTKEEEELYDDLRFNRISQKLRLEQELINFGQVEKILREDSLELLS